MNTGTTMLSTDNRGFSTSAAFVILIIGLFLSLGTLYPVLNNTNELIVDAGDAELRAETEQANIEFTIVNATYYTSTNELVVYLQNSGTEPLSIPDTDILIDGIYQSNLTNTKIDNKQTDHWAPQETVRIEFELNDTQPSRLKTITEHGIARFTLIDIISRTWPMFSYNAVNTGLYTETSGPTNNINEKWNSSAQGIVRSSPVIASGTVFIGSNDGTIYGFDTETGSTSWTFSTGNDVTASPAVIDGTVYIGSTNGDIYALNADDGSERWNYSTGGAVHSSPTVQNGIVYVGSNSTDVYAIHAGNGTEKWNFTTPTGDIRVAPAIKSGVIYVGSDDGNVYAIHANNGTEKWSNLLGSSVVAIRSDPAVANGFVYVSGLTGLNYDSNGGSGSTHALNISDGTIEGTKPRSVWSSPAVDSAGTVYVTAGDGTVYAFDSTLDTRQWRTSLDGNIKSSPAIVDGTLYTGTDNATVVALNTADGSVTWKFATNGIVQSSPAIVNNVVYVGDDSHRVYAINGS